MDDFKPNSAMVVLDFLVRHSYLEPDTGVVASGVLRHGRRLHQLTSSHFSCRSRAALSGVGHWTPPDSGVMLIIVPSRHCSASRVKKNKKPQVGAIKKNINSCVALCGEDDCPRWQTGPFWKKFEQLVPSACAVFTV